MKSNTIKKARTLFVFVLLFGIQSTQAQFWKKIEKRAKEAVEEAIIRKTEEKAAEKAENAIDSIFEAPKKIRKKKRKRGNKEGANSSEEMYEIEDIILPETYDFEWKYGLKMESEAMNQNKKNLGSMVITYYLNTETSAFGTLFNIPNKKGQMNETIMIMDPDSGANLMLLEMDGQKIMQQMPSISFEDIDETTSEEVQKDYAIEMTDTKTILGYTCQGFKITSEEGILNAYVAKNAPVSFNKTMSNKSKFKPKGFDSKWLKEFENGLMMQMEFISSKKEKYNMTMTCVQLEQVPLTVNLSEYKSFMEMGQE